MTSSQIRVTPRSALTFRKHHCRGAALLMAASMISDDIQHGRLAGRGRVVEAKVVPLCVLHVVPNSSLSGKATGAVGVRDAVAGAAMSWRFQR
jgi:hypothetical protein